MNIKSLRKFLQAALGLVFLGWLVFGSVGQASAASVIYVNAAAAGLNNGSSWVNAFTSLQSALGVAMSGQQIWVAKGTYFPATTPDRTQSFILKNGVAIYGGFAGTETQLSQRNIAAHVTILSGDIGTPGDASDNSYHVVSSDNPAGFVTSTAILDGFTITAGNANGPSPYNTGAGVYNPLFTAPTLANLIIHANTAAGDGGGMDNDSSGPTLTNVTFDGNSSGNFGGGMFNSFSSPSLTNVTFRNNSAANGGGGLLDVNNSHPILTNVTFDSNSTNGYGGGLYNSGSSPTLTNGEFKLNSAAQGAGIYNSLSNPILTNVTIESNSASSPNGLPSQGGGMFNDGSNPTLTNSTLFANSAGENGGGMYNHNSNPVLSDTTVNNNQALNDGGGMYNDSSDPQLTDVTVSGNYSRADGGGLANSNSNPLLKNVTFTGNITDGYGGAIHNSQSGPTLVNVTVSDNTARTWGGGMYNDNSSDPASYNAIFWGNHTTEIINTISTSHFTDSIVLGGCPFKSVCNNVINADPVLGPLQDNGGFTKTMALGQGSAAIDAGSVHTICLPTDQRGVSRPQGAGCDIGAYEVKAKVFGSNSTYDGWILESGMNTNTGGSLNSTSATLRVGDDASNRRYRGFLSFDTGPLPDSASLVLARLTLYQQTIVGDPFGTQVNLVTDLAAPYFGSGPTLALTDFNAPATVSSAGTFTSPSSGLYSADLNSTGLSKINLTGTTQFRLRFSSEEYNGAADYISFFIINFVSKAHLSPTLYVYYNP